MFASELDKIGNAKSALDMYWARYKVLTPRRTRRSNRQAFHGQPIQRRSATVVANPEKSTAIINSRRPPEIVVESEPTLLLESAALRYCDEPCVKRVDRQDRIFKANKKRRTLKEGIAIKEKQSDPDASIARTDRGFVRILRREDEHATSRYAESTIFMIQALRNRYLSLPNPLESLGPFERYQSRIIFWDQLNFLETIPDISDFRIFVVEPI